MRFSFELFDGSDVSICAEIFPVGYTRKLTERMADVSKLTENEFRSSNSKSLRAHTHDWSKTTRADGFPNLNEQLKDLPGWQFCLSANQHGRVHGLLIDNVFHVVWLDLHHELYQ